MFASIQTLLPEITQMIQPSYHSAWQAVAHFSSHLLPDSRPPEAGDRVLGCIRPARRCGSARLGSDWLGSVRLGSVRFGSTIQHIHHDFTISTLCMFCIKTNEFPKSEGTGQAGTRNDAVPEAAQIDTSFRISKFQLFAYFLKNQ